MHHRHLQRRDWRRVAAFALLTGCVGLMTLSDTGAAPRIRAGNQDGATDGESGSGASAAEMKKILAKLEDIQSNQQTILNRLDQVMEELKIVKIRATVR
jgi:hypothetical protein